MSTDLMPSRGTPNRFAQGKYSWPLLALFSLLAMGMGIFALCVNPKEGIVPESSLLEASGKLSWMRNNKYGVQFGLTGTAEKFEYPDKAGELGAVRTTLEGLGDYTDVTVRYTPKTHGPIYSNTTYHDVWELTVRHQKIRTYAQIAAAWESDNKIAPWLGLAFTGGGVFLGYFAWLSFRQRRQLAFQKT